MGINIEELMKTALSELQYGQHVEAGKHFDMIVVEDPTNIDAPFFRAYCNCYDIKLGEMANAAVAFTSAFYRYVDSVKALNNPELERQKLDYAVDLLTDLVSMYQYNSKNQMWSTPTIGMNISTAASNMNTNCRNKLLSVNANVSPEKMNVNLSQASSNTKTLGWLVALVILGAVGFVLWFGWGIWW